MAFLASDDASYVKKSLLRVAPEVPAAPKIKASPLEAGGLLPPVQFRSFQLAEVFPTQVSVAAWTRGKDPSSNSAAKLAANFLVRRRRTSLGTDGVSWGDREWGAAGTGTKNESMNRRPVGACRHNKYIFGSRVMS